MNLFMFTGRIITTPRLYRYKQKALTCMKVSIVNDRKGLFTYIVYAKAKAQLGHEVFDLYRTGDFIIIEGSVIIKYKKIITNANTIKNKKFIIIRIKQIHPAFIVFQ